MCWKLKKYITAKVLVAALTVGLALPFIKVLYWTFDTAYLSGFGISPEIYSRPIFSSGFVSVWLFAFSMTPLMLLWMLICLIVFIVLTAMNVRPADCEQPPEGQSREIPQKKRPEDRSIYVKFFRRRYCSYLRLHRFLEKRQICRDISRYLNFRSIFRKILKSG